MCKSSVCPAALAVISIIPSSMAITGNVVEASLRISPSRPFESATIAFHYVATVSQDRFPGPISACTLQRLQASIVLFSFMLSPEAATIVHVGNIQARGAIHDPVRTAASPYLSTDWRRREIAVRPGEANRSCPKRPVLRVCSRPACLHFRLHIATFSDIQSLSAADTRPFSQTIIFTL